MGGIYTKKRLVKGFGIGLVCLLALFVVLSLRARFRKNVITLTYAEVNPLDGTISGEMAKAFKAKAEELSGGSLRIDLQANGVLGSDDQVLDNMLSGGNLVDLTRVSALALTQYGCAKASLLAIPYTFVSEEHFWNFADSDLAQEVLMEPYKIGLPIRGLCFGEEGFRNFFFTDPIAGLEDLKGRKLRVSSDPVMTGMVSLLGASPTTLSFTELYSALSTGVVDGAEQPTVNYRSNAFQEVAPYLLLDGHTLGAIQILITDYSWNRLSEQQQAWIMEAAKAASDVCREKVAELEENTFAQLREEGVTIVEVEDKTPWVEICQPLIHAQSEEEAELYAQIAALAEK